MSSAWRRRLCRRLWIGLFCVVAAGRGEAQTGAPSGAPAAMVEADPIRCWWKSSAAAVHVGERFQVTLTCSIVEAPDVRVVVDETRLDPAAVQFVPFDVVEGVRSPDLQAGYRRLFQYDYSLRVIGSDLFARDVTIPALDVRYRVQTDGSGAGTLESIERAYRLPALLVHVATLVPPQADDVRDAPPDTLAAVQRHRFRGNVAVSAATLLFTGSVGMFAFAAAGLVRRYRGSTVPSARILSGAALLRGVSRQLQQVEQDVRRDGWSDAHKGRALAAIRLATSVASSRPAPQTAVTAGTPPDGVLVLSRGLVRPQHFHVSSSVTTDPAPARGDAGTQSFLTANALRAVIADFTAARYGRPGTGDRDLDAALREAIELTGRVRRAQPWRVKVSDDFIGVLERARPGLHER